MKPIEFILALCMAFLPGLALAQQAADLPTPPAPVIDVADTQPTLPAPPPPPERPKAKPTKTTAAKPVLKARAARKAQQPATCGPNGCSSQPAFCGPAGRPSPASCASGACMTACPNGSCSSGYYYRRGYFGGGRFFGRWRR